METKHDFKQHLVPEDEFRYENLIEFRHGYAFVSGDPVVTGTVYAYPSGSDYSPDGTKFVNVEFDDPNNNDSMVDMYFDPTDLENLAIFLLYTARQARKTEGYFNPPTDDDNGFGEL